MKSQPKRKSFPFNAPQPGELMEFGFGNCSSGFPVNPFGNPTPDPLDCGKWHHKRKSEQQVSVLPPKMLITEERITQHFSGLQISGDSKISVCSQSVNGNNNCTPNVTGGLATDDIPSTSTGKTHHPNPAYQMAAMELEQKLRNANRIVICDELKPTGGPGGVCAPVIPPEWLLKSIPRPCTALVPWQPSPLQTLQQIPMPMPMAMPVDKIVVPQHPHQLPHPHPHPQMVGVGGQELDDYDDDLEFFENNNTCSVNLNKSDEHMDEDL
ncbi:hypothetical protein KR018_005173 [Drosophila ironensis]|nr:hypothetical protein KR018_005173 [Drosophila ironensis]